MTSDTAGKRRNRGSKGPSCAGADHAPRASCTLVQGYVDTFLGYIDGLMDKWSGRDADESFGINLAVAVVRQLRGPSTVNVTEMRHNVELGGEPEWLRLKWGLVIVSRGLDVLEAQTNGLEGKALVRQTLYTVTSLDSGQACNCCRHWLVPDTRSEGTSVIPLAPYRNDHAGVDVMV